MPRVSRGPQLYLKRRADGAAIWYIRDGQRRESTGCEQGDHRGAREALGRYIARTAGGPSFGDGDPAAVTIGDILALYAQDKADQNSRPKEVRARLLRLDDHLGHLTIAAITPATSRAYVEARGAQAAARRELEDLRAAIQHAYLSRKIAAPVPISLPAKSPPRERWLTRGEAARLILGALGWLSVPFSDLTTREVRWAVWGRPGERNRHVARFILIGLQTGTRHDAILGLGWRPHAGGGHVDLRAGLIYRRGDGEAETKKRRPPTPVDGILALPAHLARWRRLDGPMALYVASFHGRRQDRMQRAWRSACRLAGLGPDVTPHVLRHTSTTWEAIAGFDPWLICGRKAITMEVFQSVYAHHHPDYLRAARSGTGSRTERNQVRG